MIQGRISSAIASPVPCDPRVYPGSEATVSELLELAGNYHRAAESLRARDDRRDRTSSAPVRFCAVHAVETYLNAFLVFHGADRKEVRSLQHDLVKRTEMAAARGLCLRKRTRSHLLQVTGLREHLVVRYGPERMKGLPDLNRTFATLEEVGKKVSAAILARPCDQTDPRARTS